MTIAIYSPSCQNHHRGFTKGAGEWERGSNTDQGLVGYREGSAWGPTVPPTVMPQERAPWPAPPPHVQSLLGGGWEGA